MWEYATEKIKIPTNSKLTVDDKLNEFGKDGWEAFSINSEKYYDPRYQIGKFRIHTATIHTIKLKRHIK